MPHRAPGSPRRGPRPYLTGKPITYFRPTGDPAIRNLIDHGFQAFNAGRLSEACHIFSDKMLAPKNDTMIGLTIAGAMTPAGLGGCVMVLVEKERSPELLKVLTGHGISGEVFRPIAGACNLSVQ